MKSFVFFSPRPLLRELPPGDREGPVRRIFFFCFKKKRGDDRSLFFFCCVRVVAHSFFSFLFFQRAAKKEINLTFAKKPSTISPRVRVVV